MRVLLIALAGLVALTLMGANCRAQGDLEVAREVQQDVMKRAIAAVPPYHPQAFPAREDINWYLRETESRDTWYVYALNRDGQPIFYVVSDMKPRNICIHITAPERRIRGYEVTVTAPALDGVYYGGAGCDAYYLRDAATGNFIELAGQTFTLLASKTPLSIETDPLGFREVP